MSWDPITRIVGNLGIYTKIDFDNQRGRVVQEHVVAVPRLQRVHEGQGPARRALHHQPHLRHLRRQPRRLLDVRAEHGLRGQDAAARRVDRQPRRGGRVHLRPHRSSRTTWCSWTSASRWSGTRTRACWTRPRRPRRPHAERPRLPHDRRHHAVVQPVHGRDVPRGAAHEPHHAGDDLPDGGAPRAPLDDLPGRRRARWPTPHAVHRLPQRGCCAASTSSRRPSR